MKELERATSIKTVIDQMGREVTFSFPPKRIVSLVPSQTELLFDLGLDDEVVGITKFCIHPREKFKSVLTIGGTKKFDFDKIEKLNPDLIIGNKEENYEEGINSLEEKYPVWMSDIFTLSDAYEMIFRVGDITSTHDQAQKLLERIKDEFSQLKSKHVGSVAYFIWKDPLMVAGNSTFINEMLSLAGFENVFGHFSRYPQVNEDVLMNAAPDYILLSSEPYPFKEKHQEYFTQICPNSKVVLADGEIFSWYGSRLLLAPDYFNKLQQNFLI